MTSREFRDRFGRRAKLANLEVGGALCERLEVYFRLLTTWNRQINLTGMNLDALEAETIDRLLIEPLLAAGHVRPDATRMMDIGSGGGSPSIPMALALEKVRLVMVEAKTRKSVFLREAARAVGLEDTVVETSRFEQLLTRPDLHESQDLVTIRAVRVEPRTLASLQALIRPKGQMLLFKGLGVEQSEENYQPPFTYVGTHPLAESIQSQLVVLEKIEAGR